MSLVKVVTVGQLRSNCFLLIDKKSRQTIIIDPGDDAEYIKRVIADQELIPKSIIATHGHFDHVLAAEELKLIYKTDFLLNKKDEFLLKRVSSSAKYFVGISDALVVGVDKYIKGGDQIKIESINLNIIDTPGHTPGSISLYDKKNKQVFVGDTIFAFGGVGRYDFKYGSQEKLINSIKELIKLPTETIVYSGHGDITNIKSVRKHHQNLV